jgi:hypothetical protein
LTQKGLRSICASSDGTARSLAALGAVGFGNFSSALFPAERRGGEAAVVPASRERSSFEFGLELELRRRIALEEKFEFKRIGTSSASWHCFVPLLFDNCIGRKRDVGGVVLA